MTDDDRKMVSELADRVFDLAELVAILAGDGTPLHENITVRFQAIERRAMAIAQHFDVSTPRPNQDAASLNVKTAGGRRAITWPTPK